MHSTLRKKLGTPDLKTPSHFVGLKLKGCSLPYPNFGHVVLANPSPLLFYPISSVEVGIRACVHADCPSVLLLARLPCLDAPCCSPGCLHLL